MLGMTGRRRGAPPRANIARKGIRASFTPAPFASGGGWVENFLVAAALTPAVPSASPSGPPTGAPAMFVVRDADTTIYIFGTFHALDGQSQWFGNQVRNAFERSNELVLETVIPERPTPIGQI